MLALFVEGLTAPRQSMRRLLGMSLGFDAIVLIILLTYLVGMIFAILLGNSAPDGRSIGYYVFSLTIVVAPIFLFSEMIYSIGKMAGGTGERVEIYLAVSWHSLIVTFLSPVMAFVAIEQQVVQTEQGEMLVPQIGANSALLVLGLGALLLWLLSSYVTEAHRFRNVWNVLGSLLMGMVGFSIAVAVVAVMLGAG